MYGGKFCSEEESEDLSIMLRLRHDLKPENWVSLEQATINASSFPSREVMLPIFSYVYLLVRNARQRMHQCQVDG